MCPRTWSYVEGWFEDRLPPPGIILTNFWTQCLFLTAFFINNKIIITNNELQEIIFNKKGKPSRNKEPKDLCGQFTEGN